MMFNDFPITNCIPMEVRDFETVACWENVYQQASVYRNFANSEISTADLLARYNGVSNRRNFYSFRPPVRECSKDVIEYGANTVLPYHFPEIFHIF